MKQLLTSVLIVLTASFGAFAQSGHWEGAALVTDKSIGLVVDLAQTPEGTWAGTMRFPDQGTSDMPLMKVVANGTAVAFDSPTITGFQATISPDGSSMRGTMVLGPQRRQVHLSRTSPVQLKPAAKSSTITKDVEGTWEGSLTYGKTWGDMTPPDEYAGAPRSIALRFRFASGPDGVATGHLVRLDENAELPIDLIVQNGDNFRFELFSVAGVFKGTVRGDEITGEWRQVGTDPAMLILKRLKN